ncbi:hypothetical protein, partial [Candidatus Sororendozoicomonas aggregata]|uniref:hypothetical protein n=1 Tax=Candidatus Sororendozoicomonas aggregata TaxID=3073239 RepID=UPI002ED617D6
TPLPPESAEAPHLEIPTPSAPEPIAQPSPPDEPFPGLKPRDSLEKRPMEEVVQELHGNMTQLRRAKTNMVADTAPLDRIPESYLNTYKIATQSFFDCIHELAEPRLKRLIRNGRKTREPVDRQETVSEAMARLICAQPSGRYDQIDMGNQLFYRMPRLIGQSYEHLYGKMSEAGKKRFFSPGTEENALREQYNLFARTMVSIMLAGEKTEAIIRYDDNGARGDSDGNFGDKSFDERFVKHFDRPHESIDWSPSPTTWPT